MKENEEYIRVRVGLLDTDGMVDTSCQISFEEAARDGLVVSEDIVLDNGITERRFYRVIRNPEFTNGQ
ncbi:hypothetical protein JXA63_05520 [Candidatus Woesebacteria bacterium]|nr:hypothetical protein [Candidatus Woesebacteria bacterium]